MSTALPQPRKTARRSKRILAHRTTMQPHHTNGMGNIFGGVLLKEMDLAGAYVARRACKNKYIPMMVTRFMNQVEFKQPVLVNDVITCWGTVLAVGDTSVTVRIEVEADRALEIIPVTSCDMVFVALDPETKKPTSVRGYGCASGARSSRQSARK